MAEATDKRSVRNRPAKRSELKQAERTRKKEVARKANQEKNRERVRTGKVQKADPGTVLKPSIWERMAEDQLYHMLREIGDGTKAIDKFQRKRVLVSLFIMLLGIPAGMFIYEYLYIAGPVAGFVFYKMKLKRVTTFYRGWKFERQLNFSKFTRLVIPYLKASGGTAALYTIFNKILKRTENEADRRSLYQLMGEMGDNPADIQPFLDYAERSSGTDMSHLFMSTIFDFQQSTFDTQVIDELGKMAGEDMMNAIDEIIKMKLKRFSMFPTKVVMCSFILVVGLGAGLMLDSFKDLDMGGVNVNPSAQLDESANQQESVVTEDSVANEAESPTEIADIDEMSSWRETLDAIAMSDGSREGKALAVNDFAQKYDASPDEVEQFTDNVRDEYISSMYTAEGNDDMYSLDNIFKSNVVRNHVPDKNDATYQLANVFWTNAHTVYVDGDRSDVTKNEEVVNKRLQKDGAMCSIKGVGKSKTYQMLGDPSYAATTINTDAGDQMFCTVRQAANAGFQHAATIEN